MSNKRSAGARDKKQQGEGSLNSNTRFFIEIGILILLAFVLRLIFFYQLQSTPFFSNLFSDSLIYSKIANDIQEGIPSKAYFMSPLYPYLLAWIGILLGDAGFWMRLIQSILGSFSVGLLAFMAKEMFNPASGRWAGIIGVLYSLFVFYDNSILIESWLTFAVVSHLLLLVLAVHKRKILLFCASGFFLGMMIVFRANIALFIPALFVYFILKRNEIHSWGKAFAAYIIVSGLFILPFTAHNYLAEGILIPVSSSAGFNFYAGNNAVSQGTYKVPEQVDLYMDLNGEKYVERQVGRELNSNEVSSFWFKKARTWIMSHPTAFLTLLGKKLLLFFQTSETDQHGLSPSFFVERYKTILSIPLPGFAFILILGLFGYIIAWRQSREIHIPLLFLAVYIVATVIFFVNGRFRVPISPIFIIGSGFAINEIFAVLKKRDIRELILPFGLTTCFVIVLLFAQPQARETFEEEYNKLGQIAFDNQNYASAEQFFSLSLNERINVYALTNLGNALAAQGKLKTAMDSYHRAIELDSSFYLAYFNLGNLAMQKSEERNAYFYWKRAVELNPDFAPAYRNIGLLLLQAGKLTAAREKLQIYMKLEPDREKRMEIERDLRMIERLLESGSK